MAVRNSQQPTKAFDERIADFYPPGLREHFRADAGRLAFQAALVLSSGATLVDVGSGLSPLGLGLCQLGMQVVLVDRFDYPVDRRFFSRPEEVLEMVRAHGVRLQPVDFESSPLPLPEAFADAVTCVACIEHLHKSPRSLLAEMKRILKPGGRLLLGTPNAVNLRKRLSVLFGRTNYPPLRQFWEEGEPHWFGHVREPTLAELVWMMEAAGLETVQRWGRNFIGRENFGLWATLADPLLRFLPGLCSDLYVLGVKKL